MKSFILTDSVVRVNFIFRNEKISLALSKNDKIIITYLDGEYLRSRFTKINNIIVNNSNQGNDRLQFVTTIGTISYAVVMDIDIIESKNINKSNNSPIDSSTPKPTNVRLLDLTLDDLENLYESLNAEDAFKEIALKVKELYNTKCNCDNTNEEIPSGNETGVPSQLNNNAQLIKSDSLKRSAGDSDMAARANHIHPISNAIAIRKSIFDESYPINYFKPSHVGRENLESSRPEYIDDITMDDEYDMVYFSFNKFGTNDYFKIKNIGISKLKGKTLEMGIPFNNLYSGLRNEYDEEIYPINIKFEIGNISKIADLELGYNNYRIINPSNEDNGKFAGVFLHIPEDIEENLLDITFTRPLHQDEYGDEAITLAEEGYEISFSGFYIYAIQDVIIKDTYTNLLYQGSAFNENSVWTYNLNRYDEFYELKDHATNYENFNIEQVFNKEDLDTYFNRWNFTNENNTEERGIIYTVYNFYQGTSKIDLLLGKPLQFGIDFLSVTNDVYLSFITKDYNDNIVEILRKNLNELTEEDKKNSVLTRIKLDPEVLQYHPKQAGREYYSFNTVLPYLQDNDYKGLYIKIWSPSQASIDMVSIYMADLSENVVDEYEMNCGKTLKFEYVETLPENYVIPQYREPDVKYAEPYTFYIANNKIGITDNKGEYYFLMP